MKKMLGLFVGVMFLGFASPALAWVGTGNSGVAVCNANTGEYDITWTVNNVEPEVATILSSTRAVVSGTVPANASDTYNESLPGTTVGTITLETVVNYPSDLTPRDSDPDGEVILNGTCVAPTSPVTPPTTTKKDKKESSKCEAPDEITGFRFMHINGNTRLRWHKEGRAQDVDIKVYTANKTFSHYVRTDDDGEITFPGTKPWYKIRAVGKCGLSDWSKMVN